MPTLRRLTQDKFTDPSYHHMENSKFIMRIRSADGDQFPSVELYVKGKRDIVYEMCNSFQRSHVYQCSSSRMEDHLENNFIGPQEQVTLKELALVSEIQALRNGTMTLTMHGVKAHGRKGDLELRIKADQTQFDEKRGVEYTRIFSLGLLMTPVYIPSSQLVMNPVPRNLLFVQIGQYFLIIRTSSTTHLHPSILLFDELSTPPKMTYRLYQVWESYTKDNTLSIPSLPVSTIEELGIVAHSQSIREGVARFVFHSSFHERQTHRLEVHVRMELKEEVYGLKMHFEPIPTYVDTD